MPETCDKEGHEFFARVFLMTDSLYYECPEHPGERIIGTCRQCSRPVCFECRGAAHAIIIKEDVEMNKNVITRAMPELEARRDDIRNALKKEVERLEGEVNKLEKSIRKYNDFLLDEEANKKKVLDDVNGIIRQAETLMGRAVTRQFKGKYEEFLKNFTVANVQRELDNLSNIREECKKELKHKKKELNENRVFLHLAEALEEIESIYKKYLCLCLARRGTLKGYCKRMGYCKQVCDFSIWPDVVDLEAYRDLDTPQEYDNIMVSSPVVCASFNSEFEGLAVNGEGLIAFVNKEKWDVRLYNLITKEEKSLPVCLEESPGKTQLCFYGDRLFIFKPETVPHYIYYKDADTAKIVERELVGCCASYGYVDTSLIEKDHCLYIYNSENKIWCHNIDLERGWYVQNEEFEGVKGFVGSAGIQLPFDELPVLSDKINFKYEGTWYEDDCDATDVNVCIALMPDSYNVKDNEEDSLVQRLAYITDAGLVVGGVMDDMPEELEGIDVFSLTRVHADTFMALRRGETTDVVMFTLQNGN